ncbi:MAG TPA: adenine phosphoribosyltransferase [Nitrospirota bacterium]|nr:adenine phosphoribosyltransferase [Nitrospirota bacterium]
MDLKSKIREIPDFPRKGILFYDITTLLKDAGGFKRVIDKIGSFYDGDGIQKVVAMESRGFILGAPVAYRLGAGFVPVRKPGKLPSDVYEAKYELEYGADSLAIHQDAIAPGERVLIVDDLIATGGTVAATVQLVKKLGGIIHGVAFLIELTDLRGRNKLDGHNVVSLLSY